MPRGWTPKPTEEERLSDIAAETGKIIQCAMIRQNVKYQMDLAKMAGISRGTLCTKFKDGNWTQKDLCKIISALKIPPQDAVRMLGVRL